MMNELLSGDRLISLVSAIVALAAYLHSRKSSRKTSEQIAEISLAHLQLSREIAESDAHREYASLVSELELEFEGAVLESKKEAREAIEQLAQLLFELDDSKCGRSYIEHRFMEAAKEVRKIYDYALTYQTGAFLSNEFWDPDRLERLAKKKESSIFSKHVRTHFLKKYYPIHYQQYLAESAAIKSARNFMCLASEIDHGLLMQGASTFFWSYTKAHQGVYEQLVEIRSKLENVRKKNRLETFSIDENKKLEGKLSRLIGDIDRFEHLRIQDLRHVGDNAGSMTIGMVFAGTVVLYVASEVDSWGLWTDQINI